MAPVKMNRLLRPSGFLGFGANTFFNRWTGLGGDTGPNPPSGSLIVNWNSTGKVNSYGINTGVIQIDNIQENSATKSSDPFNGNTTVISQDFIDAGSMTVTLDSFKTFNTSTWTPGIATVLSSNSGGDAGLGVNSLDATDNTLSRQRGINHDQTILLNLDLSSFNFNGFSLQARFRFLTNSTGSVYRQTDVNTGEELAFNLPEGVYSDWFDVNAFESFAVRGNGGNNPVNWNRVEFRLVEPVNPVTYNGELVTYNTQPVTYNP